MKWIREFVSHVILNIRFRINTSPWLMAQIQDALQNAENASENTKENTDSQKKRK